jgi:hypothetical protein
MAGIVDEGSDIIDATEEGTAQRNVGLILPGKKQGIMKLPLTAVWYSLPKH